MATALYLGLFQDKNPDANITNWVASDADNIDTTGEENVTEPGIVVTALRGMPASVRIVLDDPFVDGSAVGDPTISLTPAFAVAEEGMADEIEGWSGTLLMRGDSELDDLMTVYSNVDSTDSVPFGEQHETVAGSLLLHDTHGELDLGEDGTLTGTPDTNIDAAAFTNANFIAHANNAHDNDGDGVADYVSHMGTYQGAPGVYQCRAADMAIMGCTSRINDNGAIVLAGGTSIWTFTPNPGAEAVVADSVYLYFGWWLRERKDPLAFTGNLSVETIYGSTGGSSVYDLANTVTGAATFEGAAAGKYGIGDQVQATRQSAATGRPMPH